MKLALRYFGEKYDTVKLEHIRQIPNVKGVVSTLFNKKASDVWTKEEINKLKKEIEDKNLILYGIESLNVSEEIKAGLANRDEHIANYIESLKNLGECGVGMVCYNFMPLFDWTRTNLKYLNDDGSYSLAFNQKDIDDSNPIKLFEKMSLESNGLPGWNEDNKNKILNLFNIYQGIDEDRLFENLKYFLDAIMPICDQYNINMAIHPDDPAWRILNIPRVVTNKKNINKILSLNNNPHNGLTYCLGSLATNKENDLVDMIKLFKDRINFVHLRNIKFIDEYNFIETSHNSLAGDIDMYEIVKTLVEINYNGVVRPDHGRSIWEEDTRAGYGLYDRALGAAYINGLWEAIEKNES